MRFYEPGGKQFIILAVLGVVALLIVGTLSYASSETDKTWLWYLSNANTTSSAVTTISGTVIPILFAVAIIMKLL